MSDAHLTITAAQFAEIVATADIPQALRDTYTGDATPDGLVHWRGTDEQEVVWFFGVHRPTRCCRFSHETMGYPLRLVTCPKCLELAQSDTGRDDGE